MSWTRWRGVPWPNRQQWKHALIIGALMLGGGMGCTAFAEQTVGSGLVVAFIAVIPLMIAALNLLWGWRRVREKWWGSPLGSLAC